MNMLASVTQSCGALQSLIDDFNLMQQNEGYDLDDFGGMGGRRQLKGMGGRKRRGMFGF
jgi:hypothetical protein